MACYVDIRNGDVYKTESGKPYHIGISEDVNNLSGKRRTDKDFVNKYLKECPEPPVTFLVVDYVGNVVYEDKDLKSAKFADFKNCAVYVKDANGIATMLHRGDGMDIHERERRKQFEVVDADGTTGKIPYISPELVNKDTKWKENEVLRLYRAITAVGASLTNPPDYCRKDPGKRKILVRAMHTVLKFWPEKDKGSSARILFEDSGQILTSLNAIENAILDVVVMFSKEAIGNVCPVAKVAMVVSDVACVGLAAADIAGVNTEPIGKIVDPIGEGAKYLNKTTGAAYGFIVCRDIEEKLSAIAPFRNGGLWNKVENFILVTVSNAESEITAGVAVTGVVSKMPIGKTVEKVRSVREKLCDFGDKIDKYPRKTQTNLVMTVLPSILEAESGKHSELPYVYQITQSLFEKYYASKGTNATYTKFAMFAAIVEDMVNKRILGWKLDTNQK